MSAACANEDFDRARCPICGEANGCAMSDQGEACWCWDAVIDPAAIGRIPPRALGIVCLCKACATGKGDAVR